VTVCVATMSRGVIFGACDRMITSGDIEFEPDNLRKFWWFTTSVVAMWAGDAGFQAEVIQVVNRVVLARVAKQPDNWWNVADVVDEYVKAWREAKRKRAETEILSPIGLTFEKLISGDHGLTDYMVNHLLSAISEYRMPGEVRGAPFTETIIAGVDRSGGNERVVSHLYRLWEDQYSSQDLTAFAAIGAGAWHANSQLMQAKYDSTKTVDEAIWRTYVAKRRAEVAPGVGEKGTNMFALGPDVGMSMNVPQDWVAELTQRYEKLAEAEKKANDKALQGVGKWLQTRAQTPLVQQAVPAVATAVGTATAVADAAPTPPLAIPLAVEPPPPPESTHDQ
jgi:hypothetical protein